MAGPGGLPDEAAALKDRGNVHFLQGRYEEAEELYTQ
jgi:hypothetical protein